ncbi:MAG: CRISPR-associated protein Cas4 [Capsulimonadaceae bacterium]|nr:CRISPR-associated protein Cas4 [Capsulimonadaceae bacterium]
MERDTPSSSPPASLSTVRVTGTEVHYYVLCPRKLWWFSHGIEQEHVGGSQGAENVAMGQMLHQDSYPGKPRKEVMIDDLLRIDFLDDGVVHEIKKSKGAQRATLYQLLYYLYYLKREKGFVTTGVIDYPKQRRRETVELTPQREAEIEAILASVASTRSESIPPVVDAPMPICKKCAYQDLCWG